MGRLLRVAHLAPSFTCLLPNTPILHHLLTPIVNTKSAILDKKVEDVPNLLIQHSASEQATKFVAVDE